MEPERIKLCVVKEEKAEQRSRGGEVGGLFLGTTLLCKVQTYCFIFIIFQISIPSNRFHHGDSAYVSYFVVIYSPPPLLFPMLPVLLQLGSFPSFSERASLSFLIVRILLPSVFLSSLMSLVIPFYEFLSSFNTSALFIIVIFYFLHLFYVNIFTYFYILTTASLSSSPPVTSPSSHYPLLSLHQCS